MNKFDFNKYTKPESEYLERSEKVPILSPIVLLLAVCFSCYAYVTGHLGWFTPVYCIAMGVYVLIQCLKYGVEGWG